MEWLDGYRTRLLLIGFIVSVFLSTVSFCSACEYIWTRKADMPTPRLDLSSAVVDGKIYAIGGVSSEPGSKLLSTVEEYDPSTNTWINKADMPTARCGTSQSSAVVDGRIYVIGGAGRIPGGIPTVEEYNPATDAWTRKADMPTPRWDLSSAVVDGKIYAIGGARGDYTGRNVVEQYDPTTDTWTRKADMPLGVWGLCACVVNGKIYALGGRPLNIAAPYVQEYDPSTDNWTRKADMPEPTSNMASFVLDNKIYVIGGWLISTQSPFTIMQLYDPEKDIWTYEDVPFRRALFSADVVNNRIYAIGGTDRPHPCPALSTVHEFGPLLDFNWDGIVDSTDMCILIDNWHTDKQLYDIAPLPFGDGIVDIEDLIALSEHLFEEVFPVELIGHWKLDEDEGDIAYNSVGDNHGILHGEPKPVLF
jgi:N-acetylneuraminic acid mutarotase